MRVPNSKVKRGWSVVKIKWRVEANTEPDPIVWCEGERYVLEEEGGKWWYVHSPPPPQPEPEPQEEPEPEPIHPLILHAIGAQRYWLDQLTLRSP